jgi:hypothetical protein
VPGFWAGKTFTASIGQVIRARQRRDVHGRCATLTGSTQTIRPVADSEEALVTYMGTSDSARMLADYHPSWLDNLADDVTIEGSAMNGTAQGAEAVRTILLGIRALYELQEFNFVGPYGDNGLLEDYIAQIHGQAISCVVLVKSNAAGKAQHIVANYRPRSSLLLLSGLLADKFAGTPIADYFATTEY